MQTKRLLIFILLTVGVTTLSAQETARERIERRQSTVQQQATGTNVRIEQQNRRSEESIQNAKWSRIIYRYLDLTKEANAPLYYPVTPVDGRISLFTMLFNLLQEETIPAYEYLDGREEFTEEYRVNFQELLDRFGIYYETSDGKIVVNDVDIPGNEVEGYFVKEAYYFDTGNSSFRVRPLAICPVLQRRDDYGATTRYPLFWIPYEEIVPYARRIPVMGSSLNNSMSGSIDDFFRMRKYNGEIYKAQNPRNLAISQYTSTPEEMKAEQARLEQELIDFEKNLWKQENHSVVPQQQKVNRRSKRRSPATSSGTASISMRDRRY
ncbi:gliding motility protein GldN [Proteiniphilum acetatigenes]|uniref:type IX secretion system ring protein PorN/GldN n=1 Tax=Proteiniphilum acetatigenes TaxID=294710 RepID=UPI0003A546E8|nr:gliding motility protein GldN [Proteiniphilum acetatigenes]SFK32633.1 gliding motility associated protien GldN [Porphyromonadaceae bacterium KH3CP3RA]